MNFTVIILLLIIIWIIVLVLIDNKAIEGFDPNVYYSVDFSKVYPSLYNYNFKIPNYNFPSLDRPTDAFNPSVNRNSDYAYIPMHEILDRQMNGEKLPNGQKVYQSYRDIHALPTITLPPYNPLLGNQPASPMPAGVVQPHVDPVCFQQNMNFNPITDLAYKRCIFPPSS
jgi:hypothetical protein